MKNFNLKSYLTFLSRNKAYTAINVFGLAVSLMFVIIIGLYTWQEYAVDRQHSKADRIYNVSVDFVTNGETTANAPHAFLKYIKNVYPDVELTCGFTTGTLKLSNRSGFVNAKSLDTDSTFFRMFDFRLLRGDRATCLDQTDCMVVTQGFARRYFGTDDVVGRAVNTADNLHFRITGVVQDFTNTIIENDVDVLIRFGANPGMNPVRMDENFPRMVEYTGSAIFIQAREGSDIYSKTNGGETILADMGFDYMLDMGKTKLTRLDELYFAGFDTHRFMSHGNRNSVLILFVVGIVILVFAVMNYVNLTTTLSGYRAREMATRRLFGSSRRGVTATVLGESLAMSLLSSAIAFALAAVATPYASRLLSTDLDFGIVTHPVTLCGIIVAIVIMSIVAGALPATILSKVSPIEVIRGTFAQKTKMTFSRIFITVQNVITIVMLSCAFIMAMQMRHIINAPMNFSKENIIVVPLTSAFNDVGSYMKNKADFMERLHKMSFVEAIAPSLGTPANGGNNLTTNLSRSKKDAAWSFQVFIATPEFMDIYGIKMENDLHAKGDSIVILNDIALGALQMKPTDSHLSDKFRFVGPAMGIKSNNYGGTFHDFKIRNFFEKDGPKIICLCHNINIPWEISLKVEGDPIEAYRQIKDAYRQSFHEDIDESRPLFIDKQIEEHYKTEIRTTHMVMLFALIAIIISTLGLVAMSTYFIRQRTKEIAIRKVFGSTGNQIRARLIRTFLLHVAVAFVIAVPIVVWLMHKWISEYSYRIIWWPWIIVAGAAVLLISYAAVAIQSHIAGNENPVKNIKQE